MKFLATSTALLVCSIISSVTLANTTVTLSDVHLCCVTCQKAVERAVGEVNGTNVKVDLDKKTVTITASDDAIAQKALDAVSRAGFYGKSDHDQVAIKTSETQGNSSNVELVGFHNCCGGCENAIKSAINNVKGVDSTTVKKGSCSVNGNFDIAAILQTVNNTGFSASVKK